MKRFKTLFFFTLLVGLGSLTALMVIEKYSTPFNRSLSPLFQHLGKPLKTVDRAMTQMFPIGDIDEKMLGEKIKITCAAVYQPKNPEQEKEVRYLNALATALARDSKKPFTYEVFLDTYGWPNAFAMPGGVICVSEKLLNILDNEAELVSILAHEIGHIERGHLFDAFREEMVCNKIAATTLLTYVTSTIHMVSELGFSKAQEDEADEYSFRTLIVNGYDPTALSSAFEKMLSFHHHHAELSFLDEFFRTHPHMEHRYGVYRTRALEWKNAHSEVDWILGMQNLKEHYTIFESR